MSTYCCTHFRNSNRKKTRNINPIAVAVIRNIHTKILSLGHRVWEDKIMVIVNSNNDSDRNSNGILNQELQIE